MDWKTITSFLPTRWTKVSKRNYKCDLSIRSPKTTHNFNNIPKRHDANVEAFMPYPMLVVLYRPLINTNCTVIKTAVLCIEYKRGAHCASPSAQVT